MVQEHRGGYASLWETIELIALKVGCVPQTLNEGVRIEPNCKVLQIAQSGYRRHAAFQRKPELR